jgi:Sulfotransferase domain
MAMSAGAPDAGLVLIGAGFGRTGTTSLKQALELLGLGPCYHMQTAMTRPGHARFWIRARKGEVAADGFRRFFDGYRATVDWPACEFHRELMAAYPQARVLLNVRDADAWYDSTRATLFAVKDALPWWFPRSVLRMQDAVIWHGRMDGQFADRAAAIAAYEAHIREVRTTVPPERLLEYRVEQGWAPLCAFLGVPVPAGVPFPRVNDRRYFQRVLRGFRIANWAVPLTAVIALLAAMIALVR